MYLIDTDIVVYGTKSHSVVLQNLRLHRHTPLYVSMVTYAEMMFGAAKSDRPIESAEYARSALSKFSIAEITTEVADVFGEVKGYL